MEGIAGVLEKNKKEIINSWVQKVRQELPAPNNTSDPVLRDHLPLLIDDIVAIMKRFDNFEITSEWRDYNNMLDHSIGHGRHRSSSLGYDVEQVLKEYIILHRILTEKLQAEEVFSEEVGDILKYIIENSMLYSVGAFSQSLQEIRQKFIGILAHDLRNPASAAYLAIGMMRQDDEPERFEKIRDMARNSIKRSLDLAEDLLNSVAIGAGEGMTLHFSKRDILEFIRSVYDDSSEIYSNEIMLKCDKEEIVGFFDTAMIRRILENIINNAVKYGERGSPITISVDDSPQEVFISVHNEGNPIPEKKQKEIFEFLNTSSGSRPGELKSWGIGLSLVREVAIAHGGFLKLESNEKDGTTFQLVLSKYENEPGEVKTALSPSRLSFSGTRGDV